MGMERNEVGHTNVTRSLWDRLLFVLILALPMASAIAYGSVDSAALGLIAVITVSMVLLWTGDAFKTAALRYPTDRTLWPIIGLTLIGLVQLLPLGGSTLSLEPYTTRFFVIKLVCYLVFFAAALTFIDDRDRVRKTVFAVIVFGAALAFFGILQKLSQAEAIYGLRETKQAIPFGPFVNQHHFAGFMEMTFGLAAALLMTNAVKADRRWLLAIAAVVMGIAVVMTSSRGGLLSFLAVFAFVSAWTLFGGRRDDNETGARRMVTAVIAGAVLLAAVVGAVLFVGGENELLRGVGLSREAADITSGRSHFWQVAIDVFAAHPIIGAGLDAFSSAYPRFDTWNGTYRVEHAHNEYLEVLAEGGIVGMACVAVFIAILFRRGVRNILNAADRFERGVRIGALAGCFGILLHSIVDFPLRTPSNGYFFLLLVTLAVSQAGRGRSTSGPSL